jgi:hypothetical protein
MNHPNFVCFVPFVVIHSTMLRVMVSQSNHERILTAKDAKEKRQTTVPINFDTFRLTLLWPQVRSVIPRPERFLTGRAFLFGGDDEKNHHWSGA